MDLEVLQELDFFEYISGGPNRLLITQSFKRDSLNVKWDDMWRLWRVSTHVHFSFPDTLQPALLIIHESLLRESAC